MSDPGTPRLGDRSLFPDLEAEVYLNHAAISPPSLPVREAVNDVLGDYARRGAGAWMTWREQRDRLRGLIAHLLGASAEDLALVASTSQGVVDIALCFPWRQGDRVMVFEGEFPTNVTPWQQAAALFGLEVVFGRIADFAASDDQGLERLEAELRRGVRLVAVSAVQFQSGLRMPLGAMAELCHRHGAELFVDAMQAVGVVPLDVPALGVDYLVAGSHKWLMGPEGAGFLWIRPERIDALRPAVAAWLSHEDPATFLFDGAGHLRYDRPIRRRADFVEGGAMNALGFAGVEASVRILDALTLPVIFQHVTDLLDRLEAGLTELGFRSLRAAEPERRSAILGVLPPAGAPPLPELWRRLGDAGIACSTPDGVLRFAPHWPNDPGQIDAVLSAARAAVTPP